MLDGPRQGLASYIDARVDARDVPPALTVIAYVVARHRCEDIQRPAASAAAWAAVKKLWQ